MMPLMNLLLKMDFYISSCSNLTVNFNKAQIRNDNQLTFQNASLTTCGASPASWTLSGSEVQIDDATGMVLSKKCA